MQARFQAIKRVTIVSAIVNTVLAAVKMIIGALGGSPAVFADGIHSLSDLLGDGMVFIAGRYAQQAPDDSHPYGHHRFETFAMAMLGALLVLVGIGIGYDAVQQLVGHSYGMPDTYTIWAAIFSIAANEGLFRYGLNIARQVNSDMLRANAYHNRGDSLSSLVVLFGLLGSFAGWPFLDTVAAAIVAVFIIKMGVGWWWKAIYELTEAGVDPQLHRDIEALIWQQPGVKQMHQLRTRKLGGKIFLDVHVLIAPHCSASEGHFIAELVRVALQKKFSTIEDVTIHVDTEDHPESLPDKMLPTRAAILQRYQSQWQTIVPAEQILDVTLYYLQQKVQLEITLSLKSLKKQMAADLQKQFQQLIQNDAHINQLTIKFA